MTKVLIVEDNNLNLRLFSEILRCEGFAIDTATNGPEAVAQAQRLVPDLILLDIQLPGLSGFEVLDQLRALPSLDAVPVVAVTAFASETDQRRVRAHGFDGYLSKPVQGDALIRTVRAHLAGRTASPTAPAA